MMAKLVLELKLTRVETGGTSLRLRDEKYEFDDERTAMFVFDMLGSRDYTNDKADLWGN